MKTPPLHALIAAACACALAACDRGALVRGAVADVRGERLPGVAVTVRGSDAQDMTNALGEFELRCTPGPAVLDYSKTDYTPGVLELDVPAGEVRAADVQLWTLPASPGVYLFENYAYRECTRTGLQTFRTAGQGPTWASKIPPDLETGQTQPLILFFKLPPYDATLSTVAQVKAAPPGADAGADFTEDVWVPERTLTALVIPIDEPGHLLHELRPTEALAPGLYAVSWGAFEGHTSTSPYVFLFEVLDPNRPAVQPEIVPPGAVAPPESADRAAPPAPEEPAAEDAAIEG